MDLSAIWLACWDVVPPAAGEALSKVGWAKAGRLMAPARSMDKTIRRDGVIAFLPDGLMQLQMGLGRSFWQKKGRPSIGKHSLSANTCLPAHPRRNRRRRFPRRAAGGRGTPACCPYT